MVEWFARLLFRWGLWAAALGVLMLDGPEEMRRFGEAIADFGRKGGGRA